MTDAVGRNDINCRREMARDVVNYLRGRTWNNFQNDMYIVLNHYYMYFGKTFEMPQAMRGDYKNDGWVIEDKLFFMMFSPLIVRDSFYAEIQKKFNDDLTGLLKNVYTNGMWGGEISKAILIVNSKDNRLPADPTREYEGIANILKVEYGKNFEYSVENLDFVETMLVDLSVEKLEEIRFYLNMARDVDYNEPNASDIICTIGTISKIAIESYTKNLSTDYNRVSTFKKIKINKLGAIKEEVEMIITKLSIVERAVKEMSQDLSSMEQFDYAKNYIINAYLESKDRYVGVELFNHIIDEVSKLFPLKDNHINEIKYLVVYIFDKCDIFEKEEKEI